MDKAYSSNQLLTQVMKHAPENGQVIIQYNDETFLGELEELTISRKTDQLPAFVITGYLIEKG